MSYIDFDAMFVAYFNASFLKFREFSSSRSLSRFPSPYKPAFAFFWWVRDVQQEKKKRSIILIQRGKWFLISFPYNCLGRSLSNAFVPPSFALARFQGVIMYSIIGVAVGEETSLRRGVSIVG